MSITNLQDAFLWLIGSKLKITPINADQYKTRPERYPYAAIRIDSITKTGSFDRLGTNDDGTRKVISDRQATISIDIIGVGAMQKALELMTYTDTPTVLKDLWDYFTVSIQGVLNYQNLTNVLETEPEERAVIEYLAGFVYSINEDVGYIEHVELNEDVIPSL